MKLVTLPGTEHIRERLLRLGKQRELNEQGFLPTFESHEFGGDLGESPALFIGTQRKLLYSILRQHLMDSENKLLVLDSRLRLTTDEMFGYLLAQGACQPEQLVFMGTRVTSSGESRRRITLFDMKEIAHEGIEEACNACMSASRNARQLMLWVSTDVLDPLMLGQPAELEYGGLQLRELLYLVQRFRNLLPLQHRVCTGSAFLSSEPRSAGVITKLCYELG